MAHYDSHKNRGYDGYAVVGYSAASQSYMASTEEVVTMGGYPVRPDLHSQIWPRGSTHFQPKMSDEYSHSPKFAHTNGSPHDSPRKAFQRASSPPKGQYPNKYGAHFASPHDSPGSPRFNHTNGESPRKTAFHGVNGPPAGHYGSPRGHYSSKYEPHSNSPRDSPRKDFIRENQNRGGFSSNDDDSSDEDGECRDGVCYPTTKYGADGAGGKQGYDKENKKGNGYAPGNYPVLHTTDQRPREDPYRQNYYGGEKQPEGKNIYGSHLNNAPAHARPTTGAHYNSENEPYAVPAPIKTKPDRRHGGDNGRSSPVSAATHWTPFAESPKRGNQGRPEVIDSTEAQRRYNNAPPQYRPAAAGRTFAIDSKTAAEKYGGVFVK